MNDLIVVGFDHFDDARRAMASLRGLERDDKIHFEDTALVQRDEDGKVHVKNEVSGTTEKATAVGAAIGGIVTFAFPFAGMAVGSALGAAVGRMLDKGISGSFVNEVKETIAPGRSALFLIVKDTDIDAALALLRTYKGEIIQTTLPEETEEALKEAIHDPTVART
jgi:uncharacterized membrane protein